MKILNLTLWACIFCIGLMSFAQAQRTTEEFRLPEVPVLLTDPAERAAYLAVHYWDYFNFADTTLISRPEITEQAFVDFISILPYTAKVQVAVDTLFRRAMVKKEMLYHFISLADKYLYEPNSPMYNEELHILVLRSLLGNPGLDDWDKERPRYLLEMALKNRPGDVAADFTYLTRDGAMNRLSGIKADYVVLYFNDPDCTDCQRVKEVLLSLPVMNEFMKAGRLCLLSVCVEGKTPAWEKAIFPARWIDGYDEGKRLTREQVYDFDRQNVITKDNIQMQINALLYFQIVDPFKSVYEINNLPNAIEKLTQTTLRNIIGEMELDQTLTSRDTINTKLRAVLDDATNKWGIKVNRVELQDITPPESVLQAMEKQMQAERNKRATILTSEGEKEKQRLLSEGEKAAIVNKAEAAKQQAILKAEGEATARIRKAEAEAIAIQKITEAVGHSTNPANYLLAQKYIAMMQEVAQGKDNKVVYLPYEATNLMEAIGGIKDLFKG